LSNAVSILAASVPDAPQSPSLISVSATDISLQFYPSLENGGAIVTDYELHMKESTSLLGFNEITNYDWSSDGYSYTVNVATEGMTAGLFYEFIYRAVNSIGNSDFSGVVSFAVADVPAAPSAPSLVPG
jgi:hypothetical protein